ncbi:MAG: NAD(P)/FAD-dependent oxidoreductase, partial [Methanoregula sp.]|nr:NAD(P)/FAD-dependent oxidoreductase [Methanoregula sp.]
MEQYAVAIIGAGPAGLFCAIHAATPDFPVLLLEKNPHPGAKLRITGSGQCNITHGGEVTDFFCHYGGHGIFLKPALLAFTNADLIQFFDERGCRMETDENGKVFPCSRRSADILEILLRECLKKSVTVRCEAAVETVTSDPAGFLITTHHHRYRVARLVIATGGASYLLQLEGCHTRQPDRAAMGTGLRLSWDIRLFPSDQLSPRLLSQSIRFLICRASRLPACVFSYGA